MTSYLKWCLTSGKETANQFYTSFNTLSDDTSIVVLNEKELNIGDLNRLRGMKIDLLLIPKSFVGGISSKLFRNIEPALIKNGRIAYY